MMPQPRGALPDAYAEAAYLAAYSAACRRGIWQPQFAMGLEMFARFVSQYLAMVRALRPGNAEVVTIRELVRGQAYEWFLVDDPAPPPLPDIARICGIAGTVH